MLEPVKSKNYGTQRQSGWQEEGTGRIGGDKQRQAEGSQKAGRGRVTEQGKSLKDKQRQAEGSRRQADVQSRGKKGRAIQTEVGMMQSRGRQKKAEAEWLARGRERQVERSRGR